ncbi:BrnA antitoxin family protein [Candidatus Viridilinea mediisalina]|uniref:3-oxoacyl-ACP synthase n=1 Tax=Candidatus Viridilinea mediisalina TaxID=2024553 RepID=A0A2A6RG28_9CHLR|nr:BrnA antitoxin family protein [Candidatus Viridilinea mediisalina]PDW01838.1 hypothetical protein CJ255_17020 [Candidatus Viridilinea mediisalina]
MSELPTSKCLETDWERVDALKDDQIDTSDIPPLTEDFFRRAKVRMPNQIVTMTMRVDSDVLSWFKAQGDDYEQRMNAALRIYAEAHKAAKF